MRSLRVGYTCNVRDATRSTDERYNEWEPPETPSRFGLGVSALALAGLFAQHPSKPMTEGTVPTDTPALRDAHDRRRPDRRRAQLLLGLTLGALVEHLVLQ